MDTAMTAGVVLGLITIFAAFASAEGGQRISGNELSLTDSCGGHYDSHEGTFASPNYPDDYPRDIDCVWTITLEEPNARVAVTFDDWSLCNVYGTSDYVEFRDGNSSTAEVIKKCDRHDSYCSNVTSSLNSLYIKFQSYYNSYGGKGFKLSWSSEFCGDDYAGREGNFTSPNYPDDYPIKRVCVWTITTEPNARVTVTFDDWSLYYDADDYVEFRDGNNGIAEVIKRCDGYDPSCSDVTSSTNSLYIMFHSDSSYAGKGFKLSWSSSATTSQAPTTSQNPTNSQNPTTSQNPTSVGSLGCFSCVSCSSVNDETQVAISEEYVSCFTAIELGDPHFVIRGGTPDLHVDGSCVLDDGTFICYCNTYTCNGDDAVKLLEMISSK